MLALSIHAREKTLHRAPTPTRRRHHSLERHEVYRAAVFRVIIGIVNPRGDLFRGIGSPVVVRHIDVAVSRTVVITHHGQPTTVEDFAIVKNSVAIVVNA